MKTTSNPNIFIKRWHGILLNIRYVFINYTPIVHGLYKNRDTMKYQAMEKMVVKKDGEIVKKNNETAWVTKGYSKIWSPNVFSPL